MSALDVAAAVRTIKVHGPSRVVINDEGEAVRSVRARRLGIVPEVIFIRSDGWSLGATEELEAVAFDLWAGRWVGFMRRGSDTVTPIADYPVP
ncbi:MAG: hypothetical protein GY898_23120 [Proteobacteria bacterium]|nr:hypothetical protein [Pseudomonadota bacterium]